MHYPGVDNALVRQSALSFPSYHGPYLNFYQCILDRYYCYKPSREERFCKCSAGVIGPSLIEVIVWEVDQDRGVLVGIGLDQKRLRIVNTKYLIIIVKRFNYIDKKKRRLILLNLNIILGPYDFNLQTIVDQCGYSMYGGHYTNFVN